MIKIVDGKLKAPSRITINGFTINRVIGGIPLHELYKLLSKEGPTNQILDSVTYRTGGWSIIISLDVGPHGPMLHASIAYVGRDPSWEAIKDLKEIVFGDTDAMMVLPRKSLYVNVHEHAFHLYQIPVEWGIS